MSRREFGESESDSSESASGRVSPIETPILEKSLSGVSLIEPPKSECSKSIFVGLNSSLHLLAEILQTQTLIAEWLNECFEQLKEYGSQPSDKVQQTWLGFPIIASAISLTLSAHWLNHCYAKKNEGKNLGIENYVEKLFSSSFLFFVISLFSEMGFPSLSLPGFVIVSALCLPLLVAVFSGFAIPADNHYTCPWSDRLKLPAYPSATKGERALFAFFSVLDAFFSLTTFLWAVNRELNKKSTKLTKVQMAGLVAVCIGAGKTGYERTKHPKFSHGVGQLFVFLESCALIYAAMSGIFFMAGVYSCPNQKFCWNDSTREFLTYICGAVALSLGSLVAAMTRFNMEKEYEAVQKISGIPGEIKNRAKEIKEGAKTIAHKLYSFTANMCPQSATEQNENNSLVNV
jgi:hypothetical protein